MRPQPYANNSVFKSWKVSDWCCHSETPAKGSRRIVAQPLRNSCHQDTCVHVLCAAQVKESADRNDLQPIYQSLAVIRRFCQAGHVVLCRQGQPNPLHVTSAAGEKPICWLVVLHSSEINRVNVAMLCYAANSISIELSISTRAYRYSGIVYA